MSTDNAFSHLTLEERRIILTGITNGSTKAAIVQTIGKDKSTVGKEIRLRRLLAHKCSMPLECNNYRRCVHGRHCTNDCPEYSPFRCSLKDMRDIYNRGGFSTGYYFRQNGADMLAANRPNHTGVRLGTVTKVTPPDIFIKLETPANPQDVVEIRSESAREGLELTCAAGGNSGQTISIKGHDFKSIRHSDRRSCFSRTVTSGRRGYDHFKNEENQRHRRKS